MRDNILDHILNYSPDMICTIDVAGRFIQVSEASSRILGYGKEELEGQLTLNFLRHEDRAATIEILKSIREGKTETEFENTAIGKDGQEVPLLWLVVWLEEEDYFLCISRNVTAQKQAEKEMRRQEAVQRVLVDHSSDMQALLDANGNYLYASVAESYEKAFGYRPDEIMGENAFSLIHPEDVARIEQAFSLLLQSKEIIQISDIRFKASSGEWRWVETTASNQLENPDVQAIVVSSSDITEKKQFQFKLQESEQRFKSLFENNPDIVLFQNEAGTILDANPAFLSFKGKQKEEVVNQPLAAFLPPEVVPLFRQKLREAFSGNEVSFEAEMTFEKIGYKVLSVVKVPLFIAGKIEGVHAVMKDITEVKQANKTIERQAQKLNTIFESITDAFFTLDKNWNFTYTNTEFDKVLLTDSRGFIGKCIWDIYPEETTRVFYREYHRAVETGISAHFEAYLERLDKWLEVKAYPSDEGLSVYFSDVTTQVHQKQELEKLSLVASKTFNSVVIMDKEYRIEWVNASFTRLTGYTLPEVEGKKPFELLLGEETNPVTAQRIRNKAKKAEPMKEEVLVYKKSGEKRWFEVEVTPVLNEAGKVVRIIGMQTDITEKVFQRKELEKLSLVASKTSNSIIIMDAQRRVEWVNEGFSRMTGYTLEEVAGRNPREFLPGPDTDQVELQRVSQKIAEVVPFNSNFISYRKSGEPFWLAMDVSPVRDAAGSITHFIAIQKDITFRKEAEANQEKMSQTLYRQNKDLEQFTYIVSHNLRAPVANLMGLTDLVGSIDPYSKQFSVAVSNLRQSAHRLDTVLKDLNTILSIRDSKGHMEREEVDVHLKIEQVLTSLQERLEACGGKMTVDLEEGLCLWGSKAYLYSIFYNLLSNAIKFRSRKRPLQVQIKAKSDAEGGATITFSDNGSGFDTEKAKYRVFGLYQRFHHEVEGRGIGLYLVKAHIEAMGGQIEVTSVVGEGTTFQIFLSKVL
ncbi:PAS domain-containing sensor histidine kinase [Rufibacter roseus]|uniref:histidine kinase n=1 Tax=Rufibacter roseus TaxID=1567108 RepID=A0ABW2DTV1_9BACT|nr:PAS domain-containing sensor histidine kinase [Rufibacter roseus]